MPHNKTHKNSKYAYRKNKQGEFEVRLYTEVNGKPTSVLTKARSLDIAYARAEERMAANLHMDHPDLYQNTAEAQRWVNRRVFSEASETPFDELSVAAATPPAEIQEDNSSEYQNPLSPTPVLRGAEPDTLSAGSPGDSKPSLQKKVMIKGSLPNHVKYRNDNDGTGEKILEEPVPAGYTPPGAVLLTANKLSPEGVNNNASIYFGRDISNDPGFAFTQTSKDRNSSYRYSQHMGAGCLDLVAGRMAPFPLDEQALKEGTKNTTQLEAKVFQSPAFNTGHSADLELVQLEGGMHPGKYMDAARIYISQMTTLDYNFNIKNTYLTTRDQTEKIQRYPCSGIMLKADKVRLHSRQDLKIVTGGPNEKINSCGNEITQNNGIHLIAENGTNRSGKAIPQQPMVLGNNLIEALTKMIDLISQLGAVVENFSENQTRFNQILANHYHIDTGTLLPGIQSIESSLAGILSAIESTVNVKIAGYMTDLNRGLFCAKYLDNGGPKFINSRHNTVN